VTVNNSILSTPMGVLAEKLLILVLNNNHSLTPMESE